MGGGAASPRSASHPLGRGAPSPASQQAAGMHLPALHTLPSGQGRILGARRLLHPPTFFPRAGETRASLRWGSWQPTYTPQDRVTTLACPRRGDGTTAEREGLRQEGAFFGAGGHGAAWRSPRLTHILHSGVGLHDVFLHLVGIFLQAFDELGQLFAGDTGEKERERDPPSPHKHGHSLEPLPGLP